MVVVAATAVVLSGCTTTTTQADGPLDMGADQSEICGPVDSYRDGYLGFFARATGDQRLRITDITVDGQSAFSLGEARIIPPPRDDKVQGASVRYLFESLPASTGFRDALDASDEALETWLEPGADFSNVLVEFSFPRDLSQGAVDGLVVTYVGESGTDYRETTPVAYQLRRTC